MSNQNNNNAKIATIGRKVESEKIDHLLDKFFEIPTYQRLYEWEKDEIETLLDDMKKAWKPDDCQSDKSNEDSQKSSKQYFIGNITTSIDKNDNNRFILIDGQQRLTTLWFIGFYLASKGCKIWKNFILQNDKLRIAMPIRDNEEKALKELAMKIHTIKPNENGEINLYAYLPSDIHQKVINAFECIEKWFNAMFGKYINGKLEIDDLKQLKCFSLFIYRRVCFVFVELAQNTDLNRFFVRMNNRGKQLEKHEILKARILDKIKDDKDWQKYAKIWDLCSDMNKYIFQSASDRNILIPKNESGEKWDIDTIISEFNERNAKNAQNDDTPDKVESIIDFPTFLLHCYKLYSQDNSVPITQDKLLENFNLSKMDSESCKWFIIDMLYYRVLFDYFVIKNNAEQGNGFRIRRLQSYTSGKNKTPYYRLPEDSKSVADSPLHNLAMIQNYLRVARQGDRQNYHHWLTPFLQFLHKSELINYDYIKPEMWNPDEICKTFAKNDDGKQDDLVKFLEILDTNLAIAQLSDKELLDESNKAIKEAQNYQLTETPANIDLDSRLNNGTGTPHYWFYRLEYYLWKDRENGKYTKVIFDNKSFKDIADKFYFRNLNYVEHIQPQSRAEEKDWKIHNKGTKDEKRDIDCFGNLALLSVGFNSSLSNQDNADKRLDLQKKINKSEVESLKLWLVYANYPKDEDWTCKNAKKHLVQMLRVLKKSLKSSQENKTKT